MFPKIIHYCYLFSILLSTIHYHDSAASAAQCNPDDEAGLLALKSGFKSNPSGNLISWKLGTDCCSTWSGITCSQSRVTQITMNGQPGNSSQTLSGTISSSPALSKLQYLISFGISFQPNLSGPFPSFLLNLPNLEVVYMEHNNLSGPLPANIGILSKLESFWVRGNRFSGPIPTSFGLMTQLSQLILGGNRFTGNIPDSIGNLTGLSYLSLEENQLTGTIPDFFGKFQALNTLYLSWNQFHGVLPKSFVNLTNIFNLDLSHNLLTDPFPVMKVLSIASLDLSYNQFHLNEIPVWVASSEMIYSLKLAKCGINIKLDDWKPLVTYYYDHIDLSENEITGSPVQLLNQTDNLVGFYASGNKLNFSIESIRLPTTLKDLDLSRNLVYGKVPEAVSGLNNLNVSYNHLCGQLPKTKFQASVFAGNDCLCGSPLPQCKA